MAPGNVVVPAVVVALELHDPLAAGEAPSQPDRVVRRLRAGAAEDDAFGRRDHGDEPLGQLDLERVCGGEADAVLVHRPDRRRANSRVVVTEEDRPERRVEVDVLVAVDVPDPRPLRPGHEERVRAGAATLALDAAGGNRVRALEPAGGLGGRHRPGRIACSGRRGSLAVLVDRGHECSLLTADGGPSLAVGKRLHQPDRPSPRRRFA